MGGQAWGGSPTQTDLLETDQSKYDSHPVLGGMGEVRKTSTTMKRSPLKRKSGLRRVSPKRAKDMAVYRAMLVGWMAKHPYCEIGPRIKAAGYSVRCLGKTTHPHHVKGRIGKLLYDERYLLASCGGECHPQFVHETNKDVAVKLGLIIY